MLLRNNGTSLVSNIIFIILEDSSYYEKYMRKHTAIVVANGACNQG